MILKQCDKGHFYDGEKYPSCPHCVGSAAVRNGEDVTVPADVNIPDSVSTVGIGDTVPANWGGADSMGASFGFGPSDDEGVTMPLGPDGKTLSVTEDEDEGLTQGWNPLEEPETSEVTLPKKKHQTPVVGWLVCVGGLHIGRDFRLVAGKNTIGRNETNSIALTGDQSVSRDAQAIVAYDPKSNMFFAVSGSAQSLCYLNGQLLLSQAQLKKNDILEVGEEKLMLIPLCDAVFNWNAQTAK